MGQVQCMWRIQGNSSWSNNCCDVNGGDVYNYLGLTLLFRVILTAYFFNFIKINAYTRCVYIWQPMCVCNNKGGHRSGRTVLRSIHVTQTSYLLYADSPSLFTSQADGYQLSMIYALESKSHIACIITPNAFGVCVSYSLQNETKVSLIRRSNILAIGETETLNKVGHLPLHQLFVKGQAAF